jgi:hypothetical protein
MFKKAKKILNESTWIRKHRTMVVISIDSNCSSDFEERSNRLVSSLNRSDGNGGTIKADIFIMFDGCLQHVPSNSSISPQGSKAGGRSLADLKKFAKQSGYTQVCLVESTEV